MTATVRNITKPLAPPPPVLDLTSDLDFPVEAITHALELSRQIKRTPARFSKTLAGRFLALLFEKPSLRTRLTFELAMKQLGGDVVSSTGPIAEREPVKDVARNLDRWVQGIVARVHSQATINELAHWSSVPVINALSDLYHPCQALADVLTLQERLGSLDNRKLAYIGDGNNVAHSLMLTLPRLGMEVAVATPRGYAPDPEVIRLAAQTGSVTVTEDPAEAVQNADAVYTDVWTSMGQEAESPMRALALAPYQVNDALLAQANPDALFMHCLPAKRGQEVTDQVMESPRCAAFDQAGNRLHVQKALLVMLLR